MPDPAEHIAHSTCSPMQVLLQDQQFLVQPAQSLDCQDQSREAAFDDFFQYVRKNLSLDDLHYCSRYSALMQLLIPGRGIADYQSSAKNTLQNPPHQKRRIQQQQQQKQ